MGWDFGSDTKKEWIFMQIQINLSSTFYPDF